MFHVCALHVKLSSSHCHSLLITYVSCFILTNTCSVFGVFSFASPVTSCSFVSAVFPLCFYLFRYPYMYVSLPLFIVGSSVNLPLSQVFVYFLLFLVFKYFVFPVYVFVIILVFGHNERHASCYNLFLFPCFVCLHLGPLLSIPHSLPSQIMTHCACSHLHFMVVSVFHW